jgi:formate--tetrahydrofolate ligase
VNLDLHVENMRQFGLPPIVAVNRFGTDSDAELQMVADRARSLGARVALNEVYSRGGEGGEELGREVMAQLAAGGAHYAPLYDTALSIARRSTRS